MQSWTCPYCGSKFQDESYRRVTLHATGHLRISHQIFMWLGSTSPGLRLVYLADAMKSGEFNTIVERTKLINLMLEGG